jgi:HD-GYP domain-containing protein (c-di-GMP phosphodiesterase class II)
MDLIELPLDKFFVGLSLRYTLCDRAGQILLAKGQKIESRQQLEAIKSRQHVYVEMDQSDEGERMMMSGLTAMDRAGAPIKDFSRFLNIRQTTEVEKVTGTVVQRWGDLESGLTGALAGLKSSNDFIGRIGKLEHQMSQLLAENANGAQFLLINRAVTHFGGYSVLHSLLCATLVSRLSELFGLSDDQRQSLAYAALTMNVAMTHLQDQLALQKNPPDAFQRSAIESHSADGKKMLEEAGVTDKDWLTIVALHHTALGDASDFAEWPVLKTMVKILQTVDRYTASISPRKSRAGRIARDSARTVIAQAAAGAKHDEVGAALVGMLGLCPPGTFVKLANGETAVVMRRGKKPMEPWVASVLNRHDHAIAEPSVRDTSREEFAVTATLSAIEVRVNLNPELMIKLIPK